MSTGPGTNDWPSLVGTRSRWAPWQTAHHRAEIFADRIRRQVEPGSGPGSQRSSAELTVRFEQISALHVGPPPTADDVIERRTRLCSLPLRTIYIRGSCVDRQSLCRAEAIRFCVPAWQLDCVARGVNYDRRDRVEFAPDSRWREQDSNSWSRRDGQLVRAVPRYPLDYEHRADAVVSFAAMRRSAIW
jgi:hypothetical protein